MATDTVPAGGPPVSPPETKRPERRAAIADRTLRTDRWWVAPALTFAGLLAFAVYATLRAFQNKYYVAEPLVSPFYSPCVAENCVEGSFQVPIVGEWWKLSPALLILPIPLGIRLTCYYYRKAYYRSFWLSPPACAVAEPHNRYSGETRFPLVWQNIHRYFLYLALIVNVILFIDAILAFRNEDGEWGHLSVGTLVLLVNAILLAVYSLSCHSCRHIVGGRLNSFSRHPIRYWMWNQISRLNARHMLLAWVSMIVVALADFYVYLVANGTISDPRFF